MREPCLEVTYRHDRAADDAAVQADANTVHTGCDDSRRADCDRMAPWGSSSIVDLEGKVAELAPRVLRYAAARLGDASLAEDVAQESLTALVRHCRDGGAPESAEAFVFAVARRRAGRAAWRRRLWAPLEALSGARDAGPTPEAAAVAGEERARLRAALVRLGRRDREAILMVAAGGVTMSDAARALGVSVSAVKMRVSRARARLSALLEDEHARRLHTETAARSAR
ncbi:MAG: RNA polymerase sigma factor [Acidobacteriota bacterium]